MSLANSDPMIEALLLRLSALEHDASLSKQRLAVLETEVASQSRQIEGQNQLIAFQQSEIAQLQTAVGQLDTKPTAAGPKVELPSTLLPQIASISGESDTSPVTQPQIAQMKADVTGWMQYLYEHLVKMTEFINTLLHSTKVEQYRTEEWFNYLEIQLAIQHETLSNMLGKKQKRGLYISYYKWLELRELFPEQFSVPPTYDVSTDTARQALFPTSQRQQDEMVQRQIQADVILRHRNQLTLEQQKKTEMDRMRQRQLEVLQNKENLPHTFSLRSGLPLQLQTSAPDSRELLALNETLRNALPYTLDNQLADPSRGMFEQEPDVAATISPDAIVGMHGATTQDLIAQLAAHSLTK